MKLGFFEKAIGENTIYIKYVDKKEVEELYDKRIRALYKGKEFDVIDEKENMISIVGIVGDYREFLKLGMISIDKGIYQKWIRRDEAEIRIIKEDLLF
nr:hypothetical protein [Eubacterium sp.]